jgi:hypothetical protein
VPDQREGVLAGLERCVCAPIRQLSSNSHVTSALTDAEAEKMVICGEHVHPLNWGEAALYEKIA